MVKDLKLARRMAMDCGAPMLIANTVCSLFEAGVNELGGTSQLDEIARVYESMAGVKFAGA
jgi:3-hydroxyisobutyrate dehydrogenase